MEYGRYGQACRPARRRDSVFRTQRVSVAGVAFGESELDQSVQRAAERLTTDAEGCLQLDKACTVTVGQQNQRPWCPAVMKEADQFSR